MKIAAAAVLAGMVVAGCQSLTGAQSKCNAENAKFLPMWDCIREKVAANEAGRMNNDLGLKYLAFGDALAERVKAGQMGDAEAKYALAKELTEANTEYERRGEEANRSFRATMAAIEASRPRQTTCSRSLVTGAVDCTTW